MSDENINSMKFWIYHEENQAVYCSDCIDKRIEIANEKKEFYPHYDYENGESTGFMVDGAYKEDDCICEMCQRQIVTDYLD